MNRWWWREVDFVAISVRGLKLRGEVSNFGGGGRGDHGKLGAEGTSVTMRVAPSAGPDVLWLQEYKGRKQISSQ